MPRDAVSRTANVERNGGHKWVNQPEIRRTKFTPRELNPSVPYCRGDRGVSGRGLVWFQGLLYLTEGWHSLVQLNVNGRIVHKFHIYNSYIFTRDFSSFGIMLLHLWLLMPADFSTNIIVIYNNVCNSYISCVAHTYIVVTFLLWCPIAWGARLFLLFPGVPSASLMIARQERDFEFLSFLMEYDGSDRFPFDYEPNAIPLGS